MNKNICQFEKTKWLSFFFFWINLIQNSPITEDSRFKTGQISADRQISFKHFKPTLDVQIAS